MSEHLRRNELSGSIPIQVIDETEPGNIPSDPSRRLVLTRKTWEKELNPTGEEGFAKNSEQHRRLARFIIDRFGMKDRGYLLDVGFGQNGTVMRTFLDAGIFAAGIDGRQDPEWQRLANSGRMDFDIEQQFWGVPKPVSRLYVDKPLILNGDIMRLGESTCPIRDSRFGLMLFNGSWSAEGVNFTVLDTYASNISAYWRKHIAIEELLDFLAVPKYGYLMNGILDAVVARVIDVMKTRVLEVCKNHLTSGGLIGIVSSRYAYHGAGYRFEDLPKEKIDFLDLYVRFCLLRAKQVHLVGMTQQAFDHMVKTSIEAQGNDVEDMLSPEEIDRIQRKMYSVQDLFVDGEDSITHLMLQRGLDRERIAGVINATKNIPEFGRISRIDAMFAEF